jgi:hypothetical protein
MADPTPADLYEVMEVNGPLATPCGGSRQTTRRCLG